MTQIIRRPARLQPPAQAVSQLMRLRSIPRKRLVIGLIVLVVAIIIAVIVIISVTHQAATATAPTVPVSHVIAPDAGQLDDNNVPAYTIDSEQVLAPSTLTDASVTATIKGVEYSAHYVRHPRTCAAGLTCPARFTYVATQRSLKVDGATYVWPDLRPSGVLADYYVVSHTGETLASVIARYRSVEPTTRPTVLGNDAQPLANVSGPLPLGATITFMK